MKVVFRTNTPDLGPIGGDTLWTAMNVYATPFHSDEVVYEYQQRHSHLHLKSLHSALTAREEDEMLQLRSSLLDNLIELLRDGTLRATLFLQGQPPVEWSPPPEWWTGVIVNPEENWVEANGTQGLGVLVYHPLATPYEPNHGNEPPTRHVAGADKGSAFVEDQLDAPPSSSEKTAGATKAQIEQFVADYVKNTKTPSQRGLAKAWTDDGKRGHRDELREALTAEKGNPPLGRPPKS